MAVLMMVLEEMGPKTRAAEPYVPVMPWHY